MKDWGGREEAVNETLPGHKRKGIFNRYFCAVLCCDVSTSGNSQTSGKKPICLKKQWQGACMWLSAGWMSGKMDVRLKIQSKEEINARSDQER